MEVNDIDLGGLICSNRELDMFLYVGDHGVFIHKYIYLICNISISNITYNYYAI